MMRFIERLIQGLRYGALIIAARQNLQQPERN
jgi:hypothetical protein